MVKKLSNIQVIDEEPLVPGNIQPTPQEVTVENKVDLEPLGKMLSDAVREIKDTGKGAIPEYDFFFIRRESDGLIHKIEARVKQ